jgi:hypothetical protein
MTGYQTCVTAAAELQFWYGVLCGFGGFLMFMILVLLMAVSSERRSSSIYISEPHD